MTTKEPISLVLQLYQDEDMDDEDLDHQARRLRNEIWNLDVESVDLVRQDEAPSGTKSAGAITFGALAVAILPTALPKLIEFLKDWALRNQNQILKIKTQIGDRSVEVEYDPKSMSPTELKQLVEALSGSIDSS